MKRVTEIEICGKKFPMCFTVGAAREFRDTFHIGIMEVDKLLDSGADGKEADKVLVNILEIMRIALAGGRAAVQCEARMMGREVPEIPVISLDDLLGIYTMADMEDLGKKIVHCISLSSTQEIESVPAKNAGAADSQDKKSD